MSSHVMDLVVCENPSPSSSWLWVGEDFFLVPAHPGSSRQRATRWLRVRVWYGVFNSAPTFIISNAQLTIPAMYERHCINTYIHPFNGPLSRTTQVSQYQKGKTNLDFTKARDSEWQWNPLGHMQVCTSLKADNHTSTPLLSFLQAGCPSCHPTNSVKALKVTDTALM